MKDKIVIFGAGYYGRAVLRKCKEEKKFDCICFFDSNKKKHNTLVLKKRVYHISKIKKIEFDKIIFCGRYIEEQIQQVKKYNVNKEKFLIWGKSKVAISKQKLILREKILLKMLSYVVKKFNQNNIIYWIDFSGLLALIRKQNLAEFSDIDISINLKDVKKVYEVLKKNKKILSFNREFNLKIKRNQKTTKIPMFVFGKTNREIIEPPSIDFVVKKITAKQVKNVRFNSVYPKKYWRSINVIKYRGINLNIPNHPKEYLKYVYGRTWSKKAEFWSSKFKQ